MTMKAKQTNKIGHIEVDDVYVTVLTGRLETNEEGWQKVVPTDRSQRMTGSMIINAVVKILMETSIRRTEQMAALLEVDALELTHAVHLLTGISLQEFILQYRRRQAVEYVQCTSLSLDEIASRCGFQSTNTFVKQFRIHTGMPPRQYRVIHQPEDFRQRYRWD